MYDSDDSLGYGLSSLWYCLFFRLELHVRGCRMNTRTRTCEVVDTYTPTGVIIG